MFPLHDRLRRRICLAGFVLFCIVPTVLVVAWATVWQLPWHVRAEARRIGRQLGMEVSLGRVEHLRPGAVRLTDVVLRDPEDPGAVVRCPSLDAELKTVANTDRTSCRVLMLTTNRAEVDAARLPALGKIARRLLELRAGNIDVDVRLLAEAIDLHSDEQPERLIAVRGAVQTLEGRTEAWLEFRAADYEMTRPALILLGRNRQIQPPADRFVLYTGGAALPCRLLGRGIPSMRSLGRHARFRGCLQAELTASGWQGRIGPIADDGLPCELLGVELDRLVTDHFPHTLSGTARARIHTARFREGRLEEIAGSVLAGPGKVSRSLLRAAVDHLGLQPGSEPAPHGELVPFDQLAFCFRLSRTGGLWITGGDSPGEPQEAVMAGRRGSLLGPSIRACPAVALVRAMVPDSAVQVPATRQTDWLLRRLPTHEVVPAGAAHANSRVADGQSQTERP